MPGDKAVRDPRVRFQSHTYPLLRFAARSLVCPVFSCFYPGYGAS